MLGWKGCFVDKKSFSDRDICTNYITPAILEAGWLQHQFREEVKLTDGRLMVRYKLAANVDSIDKFPFPVDVHESKHRPLEGYKFAIHFKHRKYNTNDRVFPIVKFV